MKASVISKLGKMFFGLNTCRVLSDELIGWAVSTCAKVTEIKTVKNVVAKSLNMLNL